jgi:hypothetical protein
MSQTALPGLRSRLLVALLMGLVAGGLRWEMSAPRSDPASTGGSDFFHSWRAARTLLSGKDPYVATRTTVVRPGEGVFAYPLPAAVVATPFAWQPVRSAAAAFMGAGFALTAFGLTGLGWWRLLALLGAPVLWTLQYAQWIPILVGAALVPAFSGLLICKPTIGLALAAYRPSRALVGGAVLLLAVAFVLDPDWLMSWLTTIAANPVAGQYVSPVRTGPGPLLLLAALRWRRPEGRLLLAMALVPQNYFFYDQLPLLLVPQRALAMLAFVSWSWVVTVVALTTGWVDSPDAAVRSLALAPYVVWGLYLPALAILLRSSNTGPVPAWVEQLLQRWRIPPSLAGRAT